MASLETAGIIQYLAKTGLPFKTTSIDDSGHAKGSYHYKEGTPGDGLSGRGLACDFAGTTPNDETQMNPIHHAFMQVHGQLAELIHNGPGITDAVKDGKIVNGPSFYGPVTWAQHQNHVHVAVHKGTFLAPAPVPEPPPIWKVIPMFDPPLQVVDFLANPHGPGGWALFPDGGIGGLGGCPWRGVDQQPLGKDYWAGRHAARLEALGDGYAVVDTAGERYEYP